MHSFFFFALCFEFSKAQRREISAVFYLPSFPLSSYLVVGPAFYYYLKLKKQAFLRLFVFDLYFCLYFTSSCTFFLVFLFSSHFFCFARGIEIAWRSP